MAPDRLAELGTASSDSGTEEAAMVKSGWYCCPICGKKLLKLEPESVLYGVPVFCRNKTCKVAHYPTIWEGRELGDDEPFPMTGK